MKCSVWEWIPTIALVREYDDSTSLSPKASAGHDPRLLQSNSYPLILFPDVQFNIIHLLLGLLSGCFPRGSPPTFYIIYCPPPMQLT